jgi:hypothetical protein
MTRFDVIYVQRGVVKRRGNCLGDTVALVEKLVIICELVKQM